MSKKYKHRREDQATEIQQLTPICTPDFANTDEPDSDPIQVWENERLARMITAFAPKPLDECTVYDLGCGDGRYFDMGLEAERYKGIDGNRELIDEALAKHGHRFDAEFTQDDIANLKRVYNLDADLIVGLFGSLSYADDTITPKAVLAAFAPGTPFFLMLLCRGFVGIHTHEDRRLKGLLYKARHYSRELARMAFLDCQDVRICGFNSYSRLIREPTPWQRLDNWLGEKLFPNECEYLIVSGRTPA